VFSHHLENRNVAGNSWLPCHHELTSEQNMHTPKIFAAAIFALLAGPLAAQEVGGAIGPGPQGPEPGYYSYGDGYYSTYPRNDFWPGRGAVDVIGGAIGTAGAIASAPLRAFEGSQAYAMAPEAASCAQRYRSYDPASGTFLGYDGRRHHC
jgi:hypothetical protein